MKVARFTVQEIIKKHKESGTLKDREKTGIGTTNREDTVVIKVALDDRRKILANELRKNS